MTDVMFLIFAIDLVGVWLYGSAALYELLCRHILRSAPTGGAAAALAALVHFSTYCLMVGVVWVLVATPKPFTLVRMPL
jgi:hypothetical protein